MELLISFLLNCLIVLMTIFGFAAMFRGWDFMGKDGDLESAGFVMLRYFTIDSNVLAGVCSLIMAVAEIRVITGRAAVLPEYIYLIKLIGTAAVMLTLIVTVGFLMPHSEKPIKLIYNSNLFFHLITPVVAAVSFIFLERSRAVSFGMTFFAVIPTLLYATFYVINVFAHLDDGKPDTHYDFYNFLDGKINRAPAVIIVILAASYLITILLWTANRGAFH